MCIRDSHETDCTLEDVCACGFRLLKDGGKLSLCHRPERLAEVLACLLYTSALRHRGFRASVL